MAAERAAISSTFHGEMEVFEPVKVAGEYSDALEYSDVPTTAGVKCTMNFVGADEQLEGITREHYELARVWFRPDLFVSSMAKVDLKGFRWEVIQGTPANTEPQAEAMIIVGRSLANPADAMAQPEDP